MHRDRKQNGGFQEQWGGMNGESLLHGTNISAGEDEKLLGIDGGDLCTTMYLMPLDCTLKNA